MSQDRSDGVERATSAQHRSGRGMTQNVRAAARWIRNTGTLERATNERRHGRRPTKGAYRRLGGEKKP